MKYKITKTDTFEADVKRLSAVIPRLDEFVLGLEVVLSGTPKSGKPTNNKYIFALSLNPSVSPHSVAAYYFYTSSEVVLLYLKKDGVPPPPPIIL
jgi:hypothetical protein